MLKKKKTYYTIHTIQYIYTKHELFIAFPSLKCNNIKNNKAIIKAKIIKKKNIKCVFVARKYNLDRMNL